MIYPEIGALVKRASCGGASTSPLHQRHVHQEAAARVPADLAASSSTSTSTAWRRRTTSPSSATASSRRPSRASSPPRRPASSSARTRRSTRKPTSTRSTELFAYLTKLGVDGFMLSPAYGYDGGRTTNPTGAAEIFMTRDDIRAKFKRGEGAAREVPDDVVADLPGVPQRQARADLHGLGQPDAQRQGLEGAVLPHHRRAPRDASAT